MRVQLLFAARGGCSDALFARLDDEGRRAKAAAGTARVIGLTQLADDQFPLANPLCRPFEAVLELQTPSSDDGDELVSALSGTIDRFDDVDPPRFERRARRHPARDHPDGADRGALPLSHAAQVHPQLASSTSTTTSRTTADSAIARPASRATRNSTSTMCSRVPPRLRSASAPGARTASANSISTPPPSSSPGWRPRRRSATRRAPTRRLFVDRTNSKSFTTETRFVL